MQLTMNASFKHQPCSREPPGDELPSPTVPVMLAVPHGCRIKSSGAENDNGTSSETIGTHPMSEQRPIAVFNCKRRITCCWLRLVNIQNSTKMKRLCDSSPVRVGFCTADPNLTLLNPADATLRCLALTNENLSCISLGCLAVHQPHSPHRSHIWAAANALSRLQVRKALQSASLIVFMFMHPQLCSRTTSQAQTTRGASKSAGTYLTTC